MYDPRYDRHFEQYLARDGSKQTITKLVELFREKEIDLLDYAAPEPAFGSPEKTGAYLAGVIDGEGCIQVKPRSDGSGIERLIKIVNGERKPPESIQRLLLALNLPDGYVVDYAGHFDLWIYLNKSLISWSEEFIVPQLSLKRKAAKL